MHIACQQTSSTLKSPTTCCNSEKKKNIEQQIFISHITIMYNTTPSNLQKRNNYHLFVSISNLTQRVSDKIINRNR